MCCWKVTYCCFLMVAFIVRVAVKLFGCRRSEFPGGAQWFAKSPNCANGRAMGRAFTFTAVSSGSYSHERHSQQQQHCMSFQLSRGRAGEQAQSLKTCVQIPSLHIKQGIVALGCNPVLLWWGEAKRRESWEILMPAVLEIVVMRVSNNVEKKDHWSRLSSGLYTWAMT